MYVQENYFSSVMMTLGEGCGKHAFDHQLNYQSTSKFIFNLKTSFIGQK
jgi:hypothetical protein